jgi:hypothetical protein
MRLISNYELQTRNEKELSAIFSQVSKGLVRTRRGSPERSRIPRKHQPGAAGENAGMLNHGRHAIVSWHGVYRFLVWSRSGSLSKSISLSRAARFSASFRRS